MGIRGEIRHLRGNIYWHGVAFSRQLQRATTISLSLTDTSTRNMSSDRAPASAVASAAATVPEGKGAGEEEALRRRKTNLRKRIKSELKAMSASAVDAASIAVAERLLASPQLAKSDNGGGAVSVYLSMPGELGTTAIVSELFKRGKKVYIPKVKQEGSHVFVVLSASITGPDLPSCTATLLLTAAAVAAVALCCTHAHDNPVQLIPSSGKQTR